MLTTIIMLYLVSTTLLLWKKGRSWKKGSPNFRCTVHADNSSGHTAGRGASAGVNGGVDGAGGEAGGWWLQFGGAENHEYLGETKSKWSCF